MKAPAEVLGPTVEQLFQSMYFCDAVYSGKPLLKAPAVGAAVAFSGSVCGEFRVAISHVLALRMATDFLALDPEDVSAEQVNATVMEFANIACCATMGAWMPAATFHFSVPSELRRDLIAADFPHNFSVSDEEAQLAIDIALK